MKFLADENIPSNAVNRLRKAGFDVVWIVETSPGTSDEKILKKAHDEHRIAISFDRDFGELIFKKKSYIPAGMIYLRFIPKSPEEAAKHIVKIITQKHITFKNNFTVVHRDHIRQRPLTNVK